MNAEKESPIVIDEMINLLQPVLIDGKYLFAGESEALKKKIIFIDEETLSQDELEKGDQYGAKDE